ncbi:MAG TPA: HNH endonuclease signature motif containing protein [Microvirga sp.]|jgi:5-methylcytosine-specific restriction endonuclease McrA|nr:HNH endonuclease signature motif containing protein [Microvirga sp.]
MRREFPARVKAQAAKRANGHCEGCGAKLTVGGYHYDHTKPDGLGGEPTLENCKVLCLGCHKDKTRADTAVMTKADNQRKRVAQDIKPEGRPLSDARPRRTGRASAPLMKAMPPRRSLFVEKE